MENLVNDMANGDLDMQYIRCHKTQQDHLEHYFGQIRLRNGWSYNPTPLQFMYAYQILLVHNGKNIITHNGNCVPQDETVLLSIANSANKKVQILPDNENEKCSEKDILDNEKSVIEQTIHERCRIKECRICTASLAYIAGFYAYSLQKRIKCQECKEALLDCMEDRCYFSMGLT